MISIRKYLDSMGFSGEAESASPRNRRKLSNILVVLDAYRSALAQMGRSSVDVCAATGSSLEHGLLEAADQLAAAPNEDQLATSSQKVRTHLRQWAQNTAGHFLQKASEIRDMLLAMAQTAQSVSERDQRCAAKMHAVTAQLHDIASLDDISVMRNSILKNAAELRRAIDRMTEEGKDALDALRSKIVAFEARLEEAERAASVDSLTQLRSRLCVEGQLEQRIAAGATFCVAIFDVDGLKQINDTYGHVVGDELLKRFAAELRSACRSSDIVSRWGGDEFIVLLDCGLAQAEAQIERVSKWVCGTYDIDGIAGPLKLGIAASVGLAEFTPPETMKQLLDRADAAMYRKKASSKAAINQREIAQA